MAGIADSLVCGITRELDIRHAYVLDHDLIGSDAGRRLKIGHATRTTSAAGGVDRARGNEVILIDTITADSQPTDEDAVSDIAAGSREKIPHRSYCY